MIPALVTIPTKVATPKWQRVPGAEGLYLRTETGVYYSRYRLHGTRTFRSLDTDVLTIARLRHAEKRLDVERDRKRGVVTTTTLRTLGDIAEEFSRRVA